MPMNPDEKRKVKEFLELYESLLEAIQEAGGAVDNLAEKIDVMTVFELFEILAPNQIFFKFEKQDFEPMKETMESDLQPK